MTIPTSEILNKAADIIETRGWATGVNSWHPGRTEGGLCLEGAIVAALGHGADDRRHPAVIIRGCPAAEAVRSYLDLGEKDDYDLTTNIWYWNDTKGTEERVISVLRSAALIERARENSSVTEKVSA